MSQISEIEKLYAKPKQYKIKDGDNEVDIIITPLSLDDMGVLNMKNDMPLPELAKNAKVMFARSLCLTEEQVAKISVKFMEQILSSVMDANNFNEEDMKKTGIQEFIKQKQEQIEKEKDGKQTGSAKE